MKPAPQRGRQRGPKDMQACLIRPGRPIPAPAVRFIQDHLPHAGNMRRMIRLSSASVGR